MTSKETGTKRFIGRTGVDVEIEATFHVIAEAPAGATEVQLHDSIGILPGTIFSVGSQQIEVKATGIKLIQLKKPLKKTIPQDTLLHYSSIAKALFTSPGRDITRDTIEMNRRIRVPVDTLISYCSILTYDVTRYFVTGYQDGDSSISIGLKLINTAIDWYKLDPDFDGPLEESEEGTGDFLGWGATSTPKPEPEDREWPDSPGLVCVQANIPAYQEQISLYSDLEEPGYIPSLNRLYIIPVWIPIEIGDYIKTSEATMRVLGKDLTRIRNMQAISVDYYRGVGLDAES